MEAPAFTLEHRAIGTLDRLQPGLTLPLGLGALGCRKLRRKRVAASEPSLRLFEQGGRPRRVLPGFALVELLRYSILAVHCLTQRSAALFAPRDNLRLARREIRRLQNYTAERISTRQRDDFGQCINVSAIAPKYES